MHVLQMAATTQILNHLNLIIFLNENTVPQAPFNHGMVLFNNNNFWAS